MSHLKTPMEALLRLRHTVQELDSSGDKWKQGAVVNAARRLIHELDSVDELAQDGADVRGFFGDFSDMLDPPKTPQERIIGLFDSDDAETTIATMEHGVPYPAADLYETYRAVCHTRGIPAASERSLGLYFRARGLKAGRANNKRVWFRPADLPTEPEMHQG